MTNPLTSGLDQKAQFITIHALHTFPDVLLNRDRSGEAKLLPVGGKPRIRVSSQAAARALRVAIRQELASNQAETSDRTRLLPARVADILGPTFDADEDITLSYAAAGIAAAGITVNVEDLRKTKTVIYTPATTVTDLAKAVLDHRDELTGLAAKLRADHAKAVEAAANKKAGKKSAVKPEAEKDADDTAQEAAVKLTSGTVAAFVRAFDADASLDLALFGRFLAEIPTDTITSALRIPAWFTLEEARGALVRDYFTVVDDLQPASETGSANAGDAPLTSGTFYRTLTIDRAQLRRNLTAGGTPADALDDAVGRAVDLVISHFPTAVPGAKFTRTGSNTLPLLTLVTTSDHDVSAAPAFTRPLSGDPVEAVEVLTSYLRRAWSLAPITSGRTVFLPDVAEAPAPDFGELVAEAA